MESDCLTRFKCQASLVLFDTVFGGTHQEKSRPMGSCERECQLVLLIVVVFQLKTLQLKNNNSKTRQKQEHRF